MPSVGPSFAIEVFHSATELPILVWDAFRAHPCDSNVMYPHAEKSREQERQGGSSLGLWITCTTSSTRGTPVVDFVLSCTEGPLGSYPIFLFTTISKTVQHSDYCSRRVNHITRRLVREVAPERVFSVFAPDQVTRTFASAWSAETGIRLDSNAVYYAAKSTYCTKRSLRHKADTLLPGVEYDTRPAQDRDLAACAELCYGFAKESEPFVLSEEGALEEARLLISKRQLWVHEIRKDGEPSEIASIVAVTRTSETVAGITKVYTNPKWRQRGCAERLVRKVCKHLLKNKDRVVLYVAHNNPAAAKVYGRVGFVGLARSPEPVEGVDSWLELGFDRHHVQLGHW